MPRPVRWKIEGWEQTALRLIARIESNGAYITQAGIASITYAVRNAAGTSTGTGSLTVAGVVYDTLQTGGPWTLDNTGYNFLGTIPAASFPAPGAYIVELKFTDTSGNIFWIVGEGPMLSLQSV